MLRLAPPGFERFLQSPQFVATFGGGEANVAVALAGVVLLWFMAPTAVLVGLVLWLAFPHAMAVGVLVFMLMIGLIVLSRRRQLPMNRW